MVKPSIRHGNSRVAVALVLGAGGIKGWAHVGVLKVLHGAGVPIDLIVGASAGALIGPLYAARRDAAEMERTALGFTPIEFTEWFLRGLHISADGGRMSQRLWQVYGRYPFEDLAVPFAAVAHDLAGGARFVLREGSLLSRAVEASIRPPLFGRPTRLEGRALLDGGLHSAVPTDVAFRLGASVVIAVNVGAFVRLPPRLRPFSRRLGRALRREARRPDGLRTQLAFLAELLSRPRAGGPAPQVEIRPDMSGISAFSPWQIRLAAQRGEAAARSALPAIEQVLAVLRTA